MFELNEAVRGRLIASKSWNQGVGFLKPMWTVCDYPWGLECHGEMCAMNVCFDAYEAGIGREIRVHKVNR